MNKMIQKIFLILCVSLIWSGLSPNVFWASWEILWELPKVESIRDMQENADELKKQQEQLDFKWNTFKIRNDSLSSLVKELDSIWIGVVSSIIINYEDQRTILENKLDNNIENEERSHEIYKSLVELKKNFYTQLLPYIKTEKLTSYKNYISSDVMYNEKSKVVDVELQQLEVKKKERIEVIKEKIEDNNEVLRNSIHEKVTLKVSTLLQNFTIQEKFASLSNEQKIIIFQRIKDKIRWVKDSYKDSQAEVTSIIDEKLLLFTIVEELVDDYIKKWK